MSSAPAATIDNPIAEWGLSASNRGDPTWEMAFLYPHQGEWTEQAYLSLGTAWPIEFCDGVLEFLPMPTLFHQAVVEFLHRLLNDFVKKRQLGRAFFAPLPVRLWAGRFREPDIVFLSADRLPADWKSQPHGADLVMEVVSPGEKNRERDLEVKPGEYAAAGIQEYWIIDPEMLTIRVLALEAGGYRLHGEFQPHETATSLLLDGFAIKVADVFASGEATKSLDDA